MRPQISFITCCGSQRRPRFNVRRLEILHLSLAEMPIGFSCESDQSPEVWLNCMLISHHEARQCQASYVICKGEASVFEISVADDRSVNFQIVAEGEAVLTMIPGKQLAEVAGIPDKRCISELADVEIAVTLKARMPL